MRLLTGLVLLGTLLGLAGCEGKQPFQSIDLTDAKYARGFELPDFDGQTRRLQDFRGKLVVVFFGFTQCPDVCPTAMTDLVEVKRQLDVLDRRLAQSEHLAGQDYTIADIAQDPHYAARGMLQQVQMDDGSTLVVPGVVPKLSRTPGSHRRNAPNLGQDTDRILAEMGLSSQQINELRERGIVGGHA